ncbi:MAG TPA: hypothetical protein PLI43_08785 [Albidovulum sp.]|uniref:hypothetical protein n=1 Tax=Albidovulum sp. TaxID=1872424 RepID=UPI002BD9A0DC|nr:hypothetical protein [Albidovulum sp.]
MNLNRFLNMVVNIVTRRAINAGINKGIEMFSRRRTPEPPPLSAEEKLRQEARATARRARQAAKLTRRIGR